MLVYFKAGHRLPFSSIAGMRGQKKNLSVIASFILQVHISTVIWLNAVVNVAAHCI